MHAKRSIDGERYREAGRKTETEIDRARQDTEIDRQRNRDRQNRSLADRDARDRGRNRTETMRKDSDGGSDREKIGTRRADNERQIRLCERTNALADL
jgi:hypothetical protein